jgi:peptide deformylase
MASRILECPVALFQAAAEVKEFGPVLKGWVDELWNVLYVTEPRGIGLAGPQIGLPYRIAVIDLSLGRDEAARIVLVNPKIIHQDEGELCTEEEGCLSIPGERWRVTRPQKILVVNRTLDGELKHITGEGLLARALCHEIDHLDGILVNARALLAKTLPEAKKG